MKKTVPVLAVVILVVIVIALVVMKGTKTQPPSPVVRHTPEEVIRPRPIEIGDDATWFDLEYRGLTCREGEMQYGFAMGYGRPGDMEDNAFITAVRQRADQDIHLVYNRSFGDRTLSAVETEDRAAKRFYFDCNADGKLTDDEIFEPVTFRESGSSKEYSFVTSDFSVAQEEDQPVPLRVKVSVSFYGQQDQPQCMWSPACILEGSAIFDGSEKRLLLFMGGLDGEFDRYGRSSYALLEADQDMQYPPRATLSSLIFHEGTFYQLRFEDAPEPGRPQRVALVEDTSPTGLLAVELQGSEALAARVGYATVKGKADKSIHFQVRKTQQFPVDEYVLEQGQFQFGQNEEFDWTVSFSEGPEFRIEDNKTSTLELGEPQLAVSSVDEHKRYSSDVKDLATFTSQDRIYLSPKVTGIKGEAYARFQKRDDGGRFNDVKPHLVIKGPTGEEIVSQDLEYG